MPLYFSDVSRNLILSCVPSNIVWRLPSHNNVIYAYSAFFTSDLLSRYPSYENKAEQTCWPACLVDIYILALFV